MEDFSFALLWKGHGYFMFEDLNAVWFNFKDFIGGREGLLHWAIFCGALLVCVVLGKKERKLLFWPSVLTLIFFFNPLFYRYIGNKFLSGVYWRLLWMVPVSFITAYVLTQLVYRFKKDFVRIAAVVLAAAVIILTGERMYTGVTFQQPENDYKLPQAALDVADILGSSGIDWKVKAVVPNELLCYVRQYRCDFGLLYGRNAGGFISDIGEDEQKVYEQMSSDTPDVGVITELAKKHDVAFICFNIKEQKIPQDISNYGYYFYRSAGDYNVYVMESY